MERYKEIAQTVTGFFYSALKPTYQVDDIPKDFDPTKKAVVRNALQKEVTSKSSRIVSWNILRNYNKTKIRESLAHIIKNQNPEYIFLQEVPVYNESNFWDDELFDTFNLHYAPLHHVQHQTPFYNFAHSGQLTLSRHPFTKTKVYPLPSVSRQFLGKDHVIKRIATYAQIQHKSGKTLGLYNVHLENTAWQNGRQKQVAYLLEIIEENKDDIVIIGGDFNTFLGGLEQALVTLQRAGFTKVFSEQRITPRLDHFFVKGANATGEQLKGSGSDHQPIMMTIKHP